MKERVNFDISGVNEVDSAYGYFAVGSDCVYMHVVSGGTDYMADVDSRVFAAFMAGEISPADLCDVVVETSTMEWEEDEDGVRIAPVMTMEEVDAFLREEVAK